MAHRNVCECELCGKEETASDFWARIEFRSSQYLFDDGTCDQHYSWMLCRECKIDLLNFMLDPAEERREKAYQQELKRKRKEES